MRDRTSSPAGHRDLADGDRAGSTRDFDVYGLSFRVSGDWPEVLGALSLDFAWFARGAGTPAADVELTVERGTPEWDSYGSAPAAFVTPRNVVYQQGERTIVDYFGRAVTVLDRARKRVLIRGDDAALVHEAAYQFMLSRAGTHFDEIGWTRS